MNCITFPESNRVIGPPKGMTEEQVFPVNAYVGEVARGQHEGQLIVVVAWRQDRDDMHRLLRGEPIFLTMFGGLAPHMLTTSFQEAIKPA